MQINVPEASLTPTKKLPKNNVLVGEGNVFQDIDFSQKLFLVEKAIRTLRKKGSKVIAASISECVLVEDGIYISTEECAKIIKEQSYLVNKYYLVATILSIAIFIPLMVANHSIISIFTAIILMPFAFNFFNELIVVIQVWFFNPKKLTPPISNNPETLKSVALVIASRNEPFAVAKMTFDSALALHYPKNKKEIIVVDNTDTSFSEWNLWKNYVESYTDGGSRKIDDVRVVFIHRDGTEGFKPRNLDMALEAVTAEFILYLDVDSTLQEDTLLRAVPIFERDKSLGFVQLYTSPTNATRASSLSLVQSVRAYFLRLSTVFNTHSSYSLFYGHNAIWRTEAVRAVGSCLEYYRSEIVVTEDLSMSIRARFHGYYGVGAWFESGEWVPESLRETESMWLRWTVGTYQVYAKYFTELKNLKKFDKKELLGWIHHAVVLINYGLIPLYVMFGLVLHSKLLMSMVVFSLLPEVMQVLSAYSKLSLGGEKPLKKMTTCYSAFLLLGTFINWIKFIGLIRFIARKKQGWTPTGKTTEHKVTAFKVITDRYVFLLFGFGCVFYSIFSFMYLAEGMLDKALITMCGFYGLNCIITVILFGQSRMQENVEDVIKTSSIQSFTGFYLK